MTIEYPDNDYRSYLEHHGVKDQRWGVRNAAWYPIAAFKKAKSAAGSKVAEFREKRAAEKKKKQRAENLKKAREARAAKLKEEKYFAKEKDRILTSGTPGEVIKIAPKLTNSELSDAVNRNQNLNKLREMEGARIKRVKDEEFNKKYGKIIRVIDAADKAGTYAKKTSDAVKNIKSLIDLLGNNKDKQQDKQQSKQQDKQQSKQQDKRQDPPAFTQTVEDIGRGKTRDDKNQRGEFKSKIVDGDWTEIVTPKNVTTALSVANKVMDYYDSAKSSKSVSNGMKLLEQKNYANLLLGPVDDDRKRGGGK